MWKGGGVLQDPRPSCPRCNEEEEEAAAAEDDSDIRLEIRSKIILAIILKI